MLESGMWADCEQPVQSYKVRCINKANGGDKSALVALMKGGEGGQGVMIVSVEEEKLCAVADKALTHSISSISRLHEAESTEESANA